MNNNLSLRKTLLIIIWAIFLVITAIAAYHIENLSHDGIQYKNQGIYTYVSFMKPSSAALSSGIEIGDTLYLIDNQRVLNKHYLYNRIFEHHKPGDILQYTMYKNNEIKIINMQLENYFSFDRRIFMYVASGLYFIITLIFILMCKKYSKGLYIFTFLFLEIASLIIFINVPFSNQWLYTLFILLSASLIINLYLVTSSLLYGTFKKWEFLLTSAPVLIIVIIWIFYYIQWTLNINNDTYAILMNAMKIFHIVSVIIIFLLVYKCLEKLFNVYNNIHKRFGFLFIVFYIIMLILYPVFLALPIVLRNNELISFELYLSFFIIAPLILLASEDIIEGKINYEKI